MNLTEIIAHLEALANQIYSNDESLSNSQLKRLIEIRDRLDIIVLAKTLLECPPPEASSVEIDEVDIHR
jgi:hypothetical protein